jgi:hypothetical protein
MSNHPLRIYEVLEEEYETLHGHPSPTLDFDRPAEERLKRIIKENHKKELSALCLSGSGIRSATFGLGVLQGLAHHRILNKFDYLSTVSGGGHIGAWLSAWIHRHPYGVAGVEQELPGEHPSWVLRPEPEPISNLRNHAHYLRAQRGLLSIDTWTFGATVVRNLILNWLVLIPLMIAVLAVPRLFVSLSQLTPPGYVRVGALLLGIILGVQMIVYVAISRPTIAKKNRDQKSFLKWCFGPMLLSATLFALYWSWFTNANIDLERSLTLHILDGRNRIFGFVAFGVVLHLGAWLVYTSFIIRRLVVREFVGLLLNGVIVGLSLYLVARFFPHPAKFASLEIHELLLFSTLAVPLLLLLVFLSFTLLVGIASKFTEDADREWYARCAAWVAVSLVIWATVTFFVLEGPGLTAYDYFGITGNLRAVASTGGVIGLLTVLIAWTKSLGDPEQSSGWTGAVVRFVLRLAIALFVLMIIIYLSVATDYLIAALSSAMWTLLPRLGMSTGWLPPQPLWRFPNISLASAREILIVTVVSAGFGLLLTRFININKFSYQAMYRNRLIRAYLGASRQSDERHPNKFTGFDSDDNVSMYELRPEMLHTMSFTGEPNGWPGFRSFVNKLQARSDEASIHIVSNFLSPETKLLLARFDAKRGGDQWGKLLESALIRDLNKALLQHPILPPEIQRALEIDLEGIKTDSASAEFVRRNRRALEVVFKDEIKPLIHAKQGLFPVLNMTVNLSAWQQRAAKSFTVTPLHSGSFQINDSGMRSGPIFGSYRRSSEYGAGLGISLGTAMATSGGEARSKPKYSSPPLVMLLNLFNSLIMIRSVNPGWWLGNPGPAGRDSYRLAYPTFPLRPMVAQALGLMDDRNPYVFLSDGGQFESLGLYEMVLRRCRTIIVCDASEDPDFQFESLGNAMQKIRIDLGIPIHFKTMNLFPRKDKKIGAYAAIGTIAYSAIDRVEPGSAVADGTIVYIKPAFYGDEPRDIYHYAMTHENFPHESASDESFSEAQFESYRKLGSYIVDKLWDKVDQSTSADSGIVLPRL